LKQGVFQHQRPVVLRRFVSGIVVVVGQHERNNNSMGKLFQRPVFL
jgi:hypothetical protein